MTEFKKGVPEARARENADGMYPHQQFAYVSRCCNKGLTRRRDWGWASAAQPPLGRLRDRQT